MEHSQPAKLVYSVKQLLSDYRTYADSRAKFLNVIGQKTSCRDPLAEFSEILVSKLLDACFAPSRVQKGYDLLRMNGRHIQVRYLSNPPGEWINWHVVDFTSGVEEYALVIFENMQLKSVIIFHCEIIEQVCKLLGKRHPRQDKTLQITKRNHEMIVHEVELFRALGVEVFQY